MIPLEWKFWSLRVHSTHQRAHCRHNSVDTRPIYSVFFYTTPCENADIHLNFVKSFVSTIVVQIACGNLGLSSGCPIVAARLPR